MLEKDVHEKQPTDSPITILERVDGFKWPYKGVKGKGRARIVADKRKALSCGRKILAKYVGKGQPLIKSALDKIRSGGYVVIEITPAYFASWDYGKLGASGRHCLMNEFRSQFRTPTGTITIWCVGIGPNSTMRMTSAGKSFLERFCRR